MLPQRPKTTQNTTSICYRSPNQLSLQQDYERWHPIDCKNGKNAWNIEKCLILRVAHESWTFLCKDRWRKIPKFAQCQQTRKAKMWFIFRKNLNVKIILLFYWVAFSCRCKQELELLTTQQWDKDWFKCVWLVRVRASLPCRFGRRGWKHLFRKQTACLHFAAAAPWWSCGTRPSEEQKEERRKGICIFWKRHFYGESQVCFFLCFSLSFEVTRAVLHWQATSLVMVKWLSAVFSLAVLKNVKVISTKIKSCFYHLLFFLWLIATKKENNKNNTVQFNVNIGSDVLCNLLSSR